MRASKGWAIAMVAGLGSWATVAAAGEPACEGQRLDHADECEVAEGEVCEEDCAEIEYVRSCATQLTDNCRNQCTSQATEPPPGCDDECDALCQMRCDDGFVVVCAHNCFEECTLACPEACATAEDPVACRASCEATCDVECDATCEALAPGASCYDHCRECCRGSCRAQGKMDCQVTCQQQQFSVCETDQQVRCAESCAGGVLICDDEFVTAQAGVDGCADVLRDRGVDVRDDRNIVVLDPAPYGCGCRSGRPAPWAWLLFGVALWRRRSRGTGSRSIAQDC